MNRVEPHREKLEMRGKAQCELRTQNMDYRISRVFLHLNLSLILWALNGY